MLERLSDIFSDAWGSPIGLPLRVISSNRAGFSISVELILEKLGAGETIEELIEAHPNLSPESIRAALSFAAHL